MSTLDAQPLMNSTAASAMGARAFRSLRFFNRKTNSPNSPRFVSNCGLPFGSWPMSALLCGLRHGHRKWRLENARPDPDFR